MTNPSFQHDGFAVFDNALTADELQTLRETCDALLAEPVDDGGDGTTKSALDKPAASSTIATLISPR